MRGLLDSGHNSRRPSGDHDDRTAFSKHAEGVRDRKQEQGSTGAGPIGGRRGSLEATMASDEGVQGTSGSQLPPQGSSLYGWKKDADDADGADGGGGGGGGGKPPGLHVGFMDEATRRALDEEIQAQEQGGWDD
jgi:hypothetical protein